MFASYGNALLVDAYIFINLCFNMAIMSIQNFEEPIIEKESTLITL
jgi:hypothetical protein